MKIEITRDTFRSIKDSRGLWEFLTKKLNREEPIYLTRYLKAVKKIGEVDSYHDRLTLWQYVDDPKSHIATDGEGRFYTELSTNEGAYSENDVFASREGLDKFIPVLTLPDLMVKEVE